MNHHNELHVYYLCVAVLIGAVGAVGVTLLFLFIGVLSVVLSICNIKRKKGKLIFSYN